MHLARHGNAERFHILGSCVGEMLKPVATVIAVTCGRSDSQQLVPTMGVTAVLWSIREITGGCCAEEWSTIELDDITDRL